MKLASFDIFDTTLIRRCGKPENIFYQLAHSLYPTNKRRRGDFLAWRKSAEQVAAATLNGQETTIVDIYSRGGGEKFEEYTLQYLINAEKTVESDNLTVNPEIKAVIESLRNEGYTICFISDMYMDSTFLADVLRREGCLLGDEKVFVSCEEGARKSSGALFEKIGSLLQPKTWKHYGDHPISDVKRAKEKGIEAHLVETTRYTETENALSRRNNHTLSCLAGLQRNARLKLGNDAYNNLAADFVAAAYIPYVDFVLKKAQDEGVKRLYFLSRDSYILQKIAETQKDRYPNIEMRYLFVSRKALLLPYLKNHTPEKFLAIQEKNTIIGKSTEELLKTIGTSCKELKDRYSISFGFSRINNKEEQEEFLSTIFGSASTYKETLEKRVNEKRALLDTYFAQEKVTANEKTAMVDVGWLGTTRLMINSILKENNCRETLFFYYGTRGDVLGEEFGKFYSYFTPKELSTELTTLVENYFSASTYPSTIGYKEEDGCIIPTFKNGEVYKENKIVIANTKACTFLAKEIIKINIEEEELRKWSILTNFDILSLKNKDLDISPLTEADIFDGKHFVRILSKKELLNIMFLGGRVTAFDKASIRLTVGHKPFPLIWKICCVSSNIRRFIYLNFIQKTKR